MKNTNEKGVTLIALVITIIILLLLAGVAIAMLSGENGILNKASQSAEKTKRESAKERLKIELMAIKTDKLSNGQEANLTSLDENKDKLKEKNIYVAETGNPREVELDGYKFKVKDDLTIDGDGISTGGTSTGGTSTGGTSGSSGSGQTGSTATVNFYNGTISSPFSGGDGSETNPYIIENEAQLRFFALSVTYAENSYDGKYIKLNDNITLDQSKQWIPIGDLTTKFKGEFDGNSKEISNININVNSQDTWHGLFGAIGESGEVANLTVKGTITKEGGGIGGIAAYNEGKIKRCSNYINITEKKDACWMTGGIIGYNKGNIEECINYGTIIGKDGVGGITGVNNGKISKSVNKGSVTAEQYSAGGIVGTNGYNTSWSSSFCWGVGKIYNCYNMAKITAPGSWGGGIVGALGYNREDAKSYIYNSYSINTTTKIGTKTYGEEINCYTTEANTKLNELNAGIDDESGTDTEQPWVEDTTNINNGYPILSWQGNN